MNGRFSHLLCEGGKGARIQILSPAVDRRRLGRTEPPLASSVWTSADRTPCMMPAAEALFLRPPASSGAAILDLCGEEGAARRSRN